MILITLQFRSLFSVVQNLVLLSSKPVNPLGLNKLMISIENFPF